jgi:hypothetical protein
VYRCGSLEPKLKLFRDEEEEEEEDRQCLALGYLPVSSTAWTFFFYKNGVCTSQY